MADLIDVARYILDTYKNTTGIKLHKLLYYCQLNHFLSYNQHLIKDAEFVLKENGVICNTLYNKISELVSGNSNRLTKSEILSIESTLRKYERMTIHELIKLNKKELTEDTPLTFPEIIEFYKSPISIDDTSNGMLGDFRS